MSMLLTLIVIPELEESVTDWLLMHQQIQGFTTHAASGHGSQHALTTAEQVSGKRKQVMFWIEIPTAHRETILTALKRDFNGQSIHYWLMPITETGTML